MLACSSNEQTNEQTTVVESKTQHLHKDGDGNVSSFAQSNAERPAHYSLSDATAWLRQQPRSALPLAPHVDPRSWGGFNWNAFLTCTTPSAVPATARAEGQNNISFSLTDLWYAFQDASLFGVDVPIIDKHGVCSSATYIPHLSALRLFPSDPSDSPTDSNLPVLHRNPHQQQRNSPLWTQFSDAPQRRPPRKTTAAVEFFDRKPPHLRLTMFAQLQSIRAQQEMPLSADQMSLLTTNDSSLLNPNTSWVAVYWRPIQQSYSPSYPLILVYYSLSALSPAPPTLPMADSPALLPMADAPALLPMADALVPFHISNGPSSAEKGVVIPKSLVDHISAVSSSGPYPSQTTTPMVPLREGCRCQGNVPLSSDRVSDEFGAVGHVPVNSGSGYHLGHRNLSGECVASASATPGACQADAATEEQQWCSSSLDGCRSAKASPPQAGVGPCNSPDGSRQKTSIDNSTDLTALPGGAEEMKQPQLEDEGFTPGEGGHLGVLRGPSIAHIKQENVVLKLQPFGVLPYGVDMHSWTVDPRHDASISVSYFLAVRQSLKAWLDGQDTHHPDFDYVAFRLPVLP